MKRAIGIVRVSDTDGRTGDSFASPKEQETRIRSMPDLHIVDVLPEMDVSGGKPLYKREGLRTAVERIERGEAEILVAAYFDRLFRSLKVQAEVVTRVEAAGGKVIALDVGHVTEGSAAQWLSGTMLGAVSEYYRRSIGERIHASDARAIQRGVAPFPRIPLGYTRNAAGILEPDNNAPLAVAAFTMRANGNSWQTIRQHLADHGHNYTVGGLRAMLANRIYLGELRFGKLHNPTAHNPIVDPELFARVQATTSKRGRQPKSDLLLSRLNVLRCAKCDGYMGPAQWKRGNETLKRYRCTTPSPGHASIDAQTVDAMAENAAWLVAADREAWATTDHDHAGLRAQLDAAQTELDTALTTFTAAGVLSESAATQRLAELRANRDKLAAQVAAHAPTGSIPFYLLDQTRTNITRDELRDLIRATIRTVTIDPGSRGDRWTDAGLRVTVESTRGHTFPPESLRDPVKQAL